MSVKDDILKAFLLAEPGIWLSGEQLANSARVSRTAVWKAIETLRTCGISIEAIHGKGYRLAQNTDPLSFALLQSLIAGKYLPDAAIYVLSSTTSTNIDCISLAKQGKPEGSVVIAGMQTSGRGRRGRQFISPGDVGVYLSVLLRPDSTIEQALSLTAMAGIAVCTAIEKTVDVSTQIKWVNDIYCGDRKVCGILTEAATDLESGCLDYAVVGIGVNVYEPAGGYPTEIKDRAGCLSGSIIPGLRTRIAAAIIVELMECYNNMPQAEILSKYRERSMLTNREIEISGGTYNGAYATVLGIDDSFNLMVEFPDKSQATLHTGEVSTKPL